MKTRTDEFRQRLEADGAHWFSFQDRPCVQHFGDPLREWHVVRHGGIGIADRSERELLVLRGSEAIPWLQGLVTNDLLELAQEGSGQRTMAVNRVGRTLADARALHVPELLLLELEPGVLGSGFLHHLRNHIITEDVELIDRSEATTCLGVFGAPAAELLERVARTEHPIASRVDYQGTWGEIAGHEVILQRIPWTGTPGFHLIAEREAAAELWSALFEADPERTAPVGHDALEMLRFEAGEVRFGVDFDQTIIPLEADLNRCIAYDKGCYLGQEIIARLDTLGTPARMLRMLSPLQEESPSEADWATDDTPLWHEGKRVGTILHSRHTPLLSQHLALAYIKRGANEPGTLVHVGEQEEGGTRARVETLDFPLRSSQEREEHRA